MVLYVFCLKIALANFRKKHKISVLSNNKYTDTMSATKKSKIPPATPIIPFAYTKIVIKFIYSDKLICFKLSAIFCTSICLKIETSGMF